MRDWLLFFHILGAAGWIGGGLYGWFAYTQIAHNAGIAGKALEAISKTANRYFGPVAGVTLLSGIALVWTQDAWAWNDTFVLVGIGVFVFSAAFEPLVAAKTETRLVETAASGGDTATALRAWHRVFAIDFAVLMVALWAMVVKLGA